MRTSLAKRMAVAGAAGGLLLTALTLAGTTTPATAASTCVRTGDVLTITIGSDEPAFVRAPSGNFSVLAPQVTDPSCGGSTTTNVNRVNITGSTGGETLDLDLSFGRFEPGATAESVGVSEIEFNIDLGTGTDVLTLVGTSGPDEFQLSGNFVNLNADNDANDVKLLGTESVVINAGGGADLVSGRARGESFSIGLNIFGDGGRDDIGGTPHRDVIDGGDGNDNIRGAGGDDLLRGGNDDDRIEGHAGNDSIDGGPGNDEVSFIGAPDGVFVDLAAGVAAGVGNDTLLQIENARGSKFSDNLNGDSGANRLIGRGGDDTVEGEGGADHLFGSEGNDSLFGGAGNDVVKGGAGDDLVDGGADTDFCDGGGGGGSDTFANCP